MAIPILNISPNAGESFDDFLNRVKAQNQMISPMYVDHLNRAAQNIYNSYRPRNQVKERMNDLVGDYQSQREALQNRINVANEDAIRAQLGEDLGTLNNNLLSRGIVGGGIKDYKSGLLRSKAAGENTQKKLDTQTSMDALNSQMLSDRARVGLLSDKGDLNAAIELMEADRQKALAQASSTAMLTRGLVEAGGVGLEQRATANNAIDNYLLDETPTDTSLEKTKNFSPEISKSTIPVTGKTTKKPDSTMIQAEDGLKQTRQRMYGAEDKSTTIPQSQTRLMSSVAQRPSQPQWRAPSITQAVQPVPQQLSADPSQNMRITMQQKIGAGYFNNRSA